MRTAPISAALGAEVSGVDLNDTLTPDGEELAEKVRSALAEHQVLVFREQNLERDAQVTLARRFGTPNVHPMMRDAGEHPEILDIVKEPGDRNNFGGDWHTDLTYLENPALVSILYGVEIPPLGGDTLFANSYLAYDRLSAPLKAKLDGLDAVHTASKVYHTGAETDGIIGDGTSMQRRSDARAERETCHPVVVTHPRTGRKALYVNEVFTTRFAHMTTAESERLLAFLFEHSKQESMTCRIQWQSGTLVIWDDLATQHYALNDYHGHRRVMRRVAVQAPANTGSEA